MIKTSIPKLIKHYSNIVINSWLSQNLPCHVAYTKNPFAIMLGTITAAI